MKIYHYHQTTGEFLTEGLADENPRDPANPMIPAFATAIASIKPKPDNAVCFNKATKTWQYQIDNRGIWFKPTGEQVVQTALGAVDATWTKIAPPPVPPTAAELWVAYQKQAKALLEASDIAVLRCLEFGVLVHPEWNSYRQTLRAIISSNTGDTTQPLPTKPAYQAGT